MEVPRSRLCPNLPDSAGCSALLMSSLMLFPPFHWSNGDPEAYFRLKVSAAPLFLWRTGTPLLARFSSFQNPRFGPWRQF